MTIVVVSRGVKSGLEKAVRFLMPALLGLLLMTVAFLGFRTFRGAKPQPGVSA